ncbi:UNVERIFIED_CONTAM: hypothetical protein FKN15_032218 [Acipenser sinensis]
MAQETTTKPACFFTQELESGCQRATDLWRTKASPAGVSSELTGRLASRVCYRLPNDDPEVYEGVIQCLSLLVQLYGGGDNPECMSPENIHSFAETLTSHQDPKQQKLLLRIIKRLVSNCRQMDHLSPVL